MNEFKIADITKGMKECFSRVVTPEMMQKFLDMTGDENPLHLDEAYAKEKGFPGRVVYGMLFASLISTLGGGVPSGEILPDTGPGNQIRKAGFSW